MQKNQTEIMQVLSNPQFLDFIALCNKKYYHWDKIRYLNDPRNKKPELTWAVLKLLRTQQYRMINIGQLHFLFVTLNDVLSKLHQFDKGGGGRIVSHVDTINLEGRRDYIISSLMEEAIASSQLEGAATTRQVAKELLRLRKKPRNFSEKMIVNGYSAMQHITKMKEKEITPARLLEIQRIITNGTLHEESHVGSWRDNDEVVVGDNLDPTLVYHRPPEHQKIPQLVQELCDFANDDDNEFIHPIIKGIILHFLVGYIHPFHDGNGRTARALFYWYALHKGYWLFEFMAVSRIILRSKVKYGLAHLYTETDDNDLTYFINYNVQAIDEAFNEMQTYIERKQKEQQEALKLIRGTRDINLRQAQILKEAIRQPEMAVTIASVVGMYDVVYQTARNDLMHLTQRGYLQQRKIGKKFVFYLKTKAFVK